MHQEIDAAVNFLTRLVAKSVDPGGTKDSSSGGGGSSNHHNNSHNHHHNNSSNNQHHNNNNSNSHHNRFNTKGGVSEEKINEFSKRLTAILTAKFRGHWFPEEPKKGQGYRCIRINENCSIDGSIAQACSDCSINYRSLRLPVELTLWIDPNEVTCRFGEHKGSYCTVVKLSDGRQENYVNSINIEELEKQSLEHQKHTFELINSRKKRHQAMQAALAAQAQHQAAQQQQAHHRAKNSPMAIFNAAANSLNGVVGSPSSSGANSFHGHHHMNGLTNGQSPGGHLNGHSHQIPVTSASGGLVNGYGSPMDGYGTPNGHLLPNSVGNSGSPAGGYGAHHVGSGHFAGSQGGGQSPFYPGGNQHPFGQHHVVGGPHTGSPTAHLFGGAKYVSGSHNQLASLQAQQSQQPGRSSLNAHAAAAASLNGSDSYQSMVEKERRQQHLTSTASASAIVTNRF